MDEILGGHKHGGHGIKPIPTIIREFFEDQPTKE